MGYAEGCSIEDIPTPCEFANDLVASGGGLEMACDWGGCGNYISRQNGKYQLVPGVDGWTWMNMLAGEDLSASSVAELGLNEVEDSTTVPANKPEFGRNSSNVCTGKVLSAINNHFGTNFTSANVGTGKYSPFPWPQVPGGTINIDIFPQQSQGNSVSPGRYAVNWWTYIVGYGSTLHIPAGSGGLDSPSTLTFSSSQFTAHLDSAFPYNPLGAMFHYLIDVKGVGGHRPCP